jgi:hypothetical protein
MCWLAAFIAALRYLSASGNIYLVCWDFTDHWATGGPQASSGQRHPTDRHGFHTPLSRCIIYSRLQLPVFLECVGSEVLIWLRINFTNVPNFVSFRLIAEALKSGRHTAFSWWAVVSNALYWRWKPSRYVVLFRVSVLSEEPKKSVVRLANLKARNLSPAEYDRNRADMEIWSSVWCRHKQACSSRWYCQCVAGTNRPVPGVGTASVLPAQTGLFLGLVLPVCCRHKQACSSRWYCQCVAGTNRPVPHVSTASVLQAQTGLFLTLVLPVCCRHKRTGVTTHPPQATSPFFSVNIHNLNESLKWTSCVLKMAASGLLFLIVWQNKTCVSQVRTAPIIRVIMATAGFWIALCAFCSHKNRKVSLQLGDSQRV